MDWELGVIGKASLTNLFREKDIFFWIRHSLRVEISGE